MKLRHRRLVAIGLSLLAVCACTKTPPQALGTLEFDRITMPAPVAEHIVDIDVREGEQVAAGQALLKLDPARTQAELAAAQAQAQHAREVLAELKAGPRSENIAQARANLAAAQAQALDARAFYKRMAPLPKERAAAVTDADHARAAAENAEAKVRAEQAALDAMLHGTRTEQIAQGEAALASALAQADAQRILLDKLTMVAPRAARVDSLPYRLGDQAPVGAPLVILLAGDAPYARIYVPEQVRADVKVGDSLRVFVAGRAQPLAGKVRMIRSEPVFTPYYALIGDDAARLSYLAEVALDADAAALPAGLPVRVEFGAAR